MAFAGNHMNALFPMPSAFALSLFVVQPLLLYLCKGGFIIAQTCTAASFASTQQFTAAPPFSLKDIFGLIPMLFPRLLYTCQSHPVEAKLLDISFSLHFSWAVIISMESTEVISSLGSAPPPALNTIHLICIQLQEWQSWRTCLERAETDTAACILLLSA